MLHDSGQSPIIILAKSAVPMGIANTGTIATNGTVTLGTALNTTYSGGIWLYFPAAAFAASAAGFYWTVMSSTTAGTVYTSQTSGVAVTGSNSAYTGDTTIRTAISITLPGGSLGPNGSIRLYTNISTNNTAGAKTMTPALGATNLQVISSTTSLNNSGFILVSNRNSQILQRSSTIGNASFGGTNYPAIDTSIDQAITLKLTLAVATDVLVLEDYLIELIPRS